MKLRNNIGNQNIKEVIEAHPRIGEILDRHGIGCTKCTVGTCNLQDVGTVHSQRNDVKARIKREINAYLENL